MPSDKGPCQRLREQYERSVNAYWDRAWQRMTWRQEFLAGDRYVKDEGEDNKDRRRIQIRGMDVADSNRHIAAKLTERPRSIEARPVDNIDDPMLAQAATAIVEWDTGNPDKRFNARVEGYILDGLNMALGVMAIDLTRPGDYGNPYADRIFRRIDPRNQLWDECYEDPHERGCGWWMEKQRLPVKQIHSTWKGSGWVQPDKESLTPSKTARTGYPILNVGGRHALHNVNIDDDKATIWKCWYKNDYSAKQEKDAPTSESLPPDEQYMVCAEGCGYRSETGDKMPEAMPDVLEASCPICGGNMERVDERAITPAEQAQMQGKRLLIIAPFQRVGEEKPVYDGQWPVPTARSFPIAVWTPYQVPGEPVGICEVDNLRDAQIASDQLKTHMLKQVFAHQVYFKQPWGVYENYLHEQWTGVDTDYNNIFYDASNQFAAPIERLEGMGLDPNIGVALQIIDNTLNRFKPSGDISLVPGQSPDIAVGTVEALERQGETPVEHMNRRKNDSFAMFYGVDWDYCRKTITAEQLMELDIEGTRLVVDGIAGDDLPGFNFWIEDTPRSAGIEKNQASAYQALIQAGDNAVATGKDPQLAIELLGDIANLPPTSVRKAQQLFAPPEMGGMPGAPPSAGGESGAGAEGPGFPPESFDEGLNGADMSSAPVA